MAWVLSMVSQLQQFGGLPQDRVENVVNVGFAAEPTPGEVISCLSEFGSFYIDISGAQVQSVSQYLSEVLLRNPGGASIYAYKTNDLTGATPLGSPVGSSTFTLDSAVGTTQYPEEVCVALSFNGELLDIPQTAPNPTPPPLTIRPAQRRRGRIYIGPLGNNAATDGPQSLRPSTQFMTDLGIAFAKMCNDIATATTGEVCVWSKADAATYAVVEGFVDNAWDTQRRRGLSASARVPFTV